MRRSQALLHVTEAQLKWLLRPGGPWQIVLLGVYAVFTGTLSPSQRRRAALLYVDEMAGDGTRAVITGAEACRLYGMYDVPGDEITVLIDARWRKQSRGFVAVSRTHRFPVHCAIRQGVPVAPLARCVLDACRRLGDLDAVRGLMTQAVQRHQVSVESLSRELERGSVRGSARPRRVMQELILGAQSVSEADLVTLMSDSEVLPPAHHNCDLLAPDGAFLCRPDGYIEEVGLAVQVQSLRYHLDPSAQERDYNQRLTLGRYGVLVAEVRPNRLRREGRTFLSELEATYVDRQTQGTCANVVLRCRPGCRRAIRAAS